MRWDGQLLDAVDGETLPGLERSRGLVRTFDTPEFRGMEFLEVSSRSALNRVPGNGFMGGQWTINPYRGCQHACVYCLSPDTLVLMADGQQRAIRTLEVGDEVVGTRLVGRYRRYVHTRVLARWSTRKRAYRVTLADGTVLIASGEHRFLTERGWKHVVGAMSGPGQRPYLTTGDRLMGFGRVEPEVAPISDDAPAVTSTADLRVVAVEDLGHEADMVDITTGTGDFIAEGIISHNCFARHTHTYLDLDAGADFDSRVVVKTNIAEALDAELHRRRGERPERVLLGTNTDPYQRAEGRYRLLPGIIRTLARHGVGVSILTKGTLLRRDLPLLAEVAERVPVDLSMSIAVFDDDLQASVEPGTPTTAARLATVRAVRDAGLSCGVLLMPVLPGLTDTAEHLDGAFARLAEAGATSVSVSALHLRPGAREWYLQWLGQERPDLVERYERLYAGGANATRVYRDWLHEHVEQVRRRHRLELAAPRRRWHPDPARRDGTPAAPAPAARPPEQEALF